MKKIILLVLGFFCIAGCFFGPGDWAVNVKIVPMFGSKKIENGTITFVNCDNSPILDIDWKNMYYPEFTEAKLGHHEDTYFLAVPWEPDRIRVAVYCEGFEPYYSKCIDMKRKVGKTLRLGKIKLTKAQPVK